MVKKKWAVFTIMVLIPLVSGQIEWVPENDLGCVCTLAKSTDKLVFIYIYDEWTARTDRIFENASTYEYINTHFCAMRVYKGDAQALWKSYDIEIAPTVLFLDGYGGEIGRIEEPADSSSFYNEMKRIVEAKELKDTLKDDAYLALTEADSLYAKGKYRESKEQYAIAMEKFRQLGNEEREEYCRSKITHANLRMQLTLLKYGLVMFVGIVTFLALIYYILKRER